MGVCAGRGRVSGVSSLELAMVYTCKTAGRNRVFVVVSIVLEYTALGTPENNTGWLSHGWRGARPTSPAAPWALPSVIAPSPVIASEVKQSHSPWNVLLGGSLSVFGLELMGARTYDPSTHSFLTTDPLPPVLGTPYAANPYEYAGNNPLALLDPLGMRALTDQEFITMATAYNANVEKANAGWWDKYGDYIIGGVAVVAGAALIAVTGGAGTPLVLSVLGSAAGASTMWTGFSIMSDKKNKGSVDYRAKAQEWLVGTAVAIPLAFAWELTPIAAALAGESAALRGFLEIPFAWLGATPASAAEEWIDRTFDIGEPNPGSYVDGVRQRTADNMGMSVVNNGLESVGGIRGKK